MVSRHAEQRPQDMVTTPWGHLSLQMKLLFITGNDRPGDWLVEALAVDSGSEVQLEQTGHLAQGLAILRDQVFDAVLIHYDSDENDTLSTLSAIRTGSSDDQPIVVLSRLPSEELSVPCYEAGADAYLCTEKATTRLLLWEISRAIQRHQMSSENRRLQQLSHQRLRMEQDETGRLLQQQREMVSGGTGDFQAVNSLPRDWSTTCLQDMEEPVALPSPLVSHYRELLRTYVIMGSGNLSQEMTEWVRQLVSKKVTAPQVMKMHLLVVEQMVHGLGSNSARHLMNRADLLIMEVMIHLVENYRKQRESPQTVLARPIAVEKDMLTE